MLRFIDLFAGIGWLRLGFENACTKLGFEAECIFTSEIKPHAISVLRWNFHEAEIHGDITKINAENIGDFDFLLAGFPCQAFSFAGKRRGFSDSRGALFFDVLRILKAKLPKVFILENVEGLVKHDNGRTFKVILSSLEELGYKVAYRVLDAKDFGLPQERRRIYIVGSVRAQPDMLYFECSHNKLSSILEHGLECESSEFISTLLGHYKVNELVGKSIKDKRGGSNNIHSWNIELKGSVSPEQRKLLDTILTERRKKHWADEYGIDWMDGMPLTLDMIKIFYNIPHLEAMLDDLVSKRYLVKEHPKALLNGRRVYDTSLPLGYNIVAGKISYPINKILDPEGVTPTLVAMDMERLYVVDGAGLRKLSLREGLRLFGFPEDYNFANITLQEGYDLLGNTVAVPVVAAVAERLLKIYC